MIPRNGITTYRLMVFTVAVLTVACATAAVNTGGASLDGRLDARTDQSGSLAAGGANVEREKLAFEERKHSELLKLEEEKLALQSRQAFWSAIATTIPMLVALGTVIFGVWSLRQQTRLQFELKAAEIMFAAGTAVGMKKRGQFLKMTFGQRLPPDFLDTFDPEPKEPSAEKQVLLNLLMTYPDRRADVMRLWEQLFPGDQDWFQRVSLPASVSTTKSSGSAATGSAVRDDPSGRRTPAGTPENGKE